MTRSEADPDRGRSAEEETRLLRRAVEELSVLNDLAKEIGASLDSRRIMQTIIRRSVDAVDGEQGAVTLIQDESGSEPLGRTLVRAAESSSSHPAFHAKDAIIGWMLLNKRALLANEPRRDERFKGVEWHDSVRSFLCAPLLVKSKLIGVVTAYNKQSPGGFDENDQRLLSIIAAQSAQVIENARLYEEERALMRVRHELQLASEIQAALLPDSQPTLDGYDIAGASIPAREVGGDYFDFIEIGEDRLSVCLGDVSGKGLPAALLMANLQATVRGQVLVDPHPKTCLERSNRLLHGCTGADRFATFFYGLLDARRHTFAYANAGHERPMLVRGNGELRRLEPGGLVLSFLEGAVYDDETISVDPQDTIVIYSDGITEAFDERDEQFGEERLIELLAGRAATPASALIDDILQAVRRHAAGRPQTDDMTLVALRRSKS
jgi:sigma-B regulation protein RsbU (phosphoserine phosphatase)